MVVACSLLREGPIVFWKLALLAGELSLAYLEAVDNVGLTILSLPGLKHQSGKESKQVEEFSACQE